MVRFCQYLASRNYSPFTIEQRTRAISAFIAWAAVRGVERPQDVTLPILERYQQHLFHHRKADGEPLTFRTQIVRLVPLRAFFKWLVRERVILFNPAADLELPRGEKRLPATILSTDEVEAVMALPVSRHTAGPARSRHPRSALCDRRAAFGGHAAARV
jgi:integrase/recombinase XerD